MRPVRFESKKIKRVKKPKHSTTSKKLILFIILSIFSFTSIAVYVQLKIGVELSPTLITCFYAFCTGELWMLATIKKSKLKNGQKENQYHDFIVKPEDDDEAKG